MKAFARCKQVLVLTERFNIDIKDFVAKESVRYNRVLFVIELVTSGTKLFVLTEFVTSGIQ